jgi:ATP-dependent RNA helicase SUPV3L1/SUV3
VTTFVKTDLPILTHILKQPLETTSRAGLHPTSEQIELFGYHLPNHSLTELLRIFIAICRIDDGQYFLCNFDEIQYLASMIDHIPLKLKTKYTFATSPISEKQTYVCSCFAKFVRSYSNNEPINTEYLMKMLGWPLKVPSNLSEVMHLENVYDVLDLYLWLGYRFPEIFVDREQCKEMRIELEKVLFLFHFNLLVFIIP